MSSMHRLCRSVDSVRTVQRGFGWPAGGPLRELSGMSRWVRLGVDEGEAGDAGAQHYVTMLLGQMQAIRNLS